MLPMPNPSVRLCSGPQCASGGNRSAEGIMASGHVNRTKGRTHGCTDHRCNVPETLDSPEPSTHGPQSPFAALHKFGSYRGIIGRASDVARPVGLDPKPTKCTGSTLTLQICVVSR